MLWWIDQINNSGLQIKGIIIGEGKGWNQELDEGLLIDLWK